MASKGPKTQKGKMRKLLTGDGRQSILTDKLTEKFVKEDRDRTAKAKKMLLKKKKDNDPWWI